MTQFSNLENQVELAIQSAMGKISNCPIDKIRLYFELNLVFDGSVGYAQVFLHVEKQKFLIGEFRQGRETYDLYKWVDIVIEVARRLFHTHIPTEYVKLGQRMDSSVETRLIDLIKRCLDEAEEEKNRHLEDIEEVDDSGDTTYIDEQGIEMTLEQWRQSIKESLFYVGSMSALNDIISKCEEAIAKIRNITFIEDAIKVVEELHDYFVEREKSTAQQSHNDMKEVAWYKHQCYDDAVRELWISELDLVRGEYWLPSLYGLS